MARPLDSLISRAMSLLAKRRMTRMTATQRKEIAAKGGRAWWDKLTEVERRRAIERIQKARKDKLAKALSPEPGTEPVKAKILSRGSDLKNKRGRHGPAHT